MANVYGLYTGAPTYSAAGSAPAVVNLTLDGTTDSIEWVCAPPEACTITRLGFRLSTITGTSPTFALSLQGVTTAGRADGTIKSAGGAVDTFNPSGLGLTAGTWYWRTLGSSYAAAPGESLAIVLAYSSGTIDASNSIAVLTHVSNTVAAQRYPHAIQVNAGAATRQVGLPIYGYGSSTLAYGRPAKNINAIVYNNGSTPDEYAVKYTLPAGMGATYTVLATRWSALVATGQTVLVNLYDGGGTSDTTVLNTVTWDTDLTSLNNASGIFEVPWTDTTLATQTFGQTYRIGLAPQSATNMQVFEVVAEAVEDFDAWPGGQLFSLSTRSNGGANTWTDTTTRRLWMDIVFADMSEPVGGGGLAYSPIGRIIA
jgi:hypothetical protein